jgi:hypothetical protein
LARNCNEAQNVFPNSNVSIHEYLKQPVFSTTRNTSIETKICHSNMLSCPCNISSFITLFEVQRNAPITLGGIVSSKQSHLPIGPILSNLPYIYLHFVVVRILLSSFESRFGWGKKQKEGGKY